jgi:hypothetical protein
MGQRSSTRPSLPLLFADEDVSVEARGDDTVIDQLDLPVALSMPVAMSVSGAATPRAPLPVVTFVVDCRSDDELAQLLYPFVEGDRLVLPAHPLLTIGDERGLCLERAGEVVFHGVCGAIETIGDADAAKAAHVRVQLLGLDIAGRALLARLAFLKRFHRRPGAGALLDPPALARLSRHLRAVNRAPTVEATAILDSADLEEMPAKAAPDAGPPRQPPPVPVRRETLARRAQVLARIERTPVPGLAGSAARTANSPSVSLSKLRTAAPGWVLLVVLLGLGGILFYWR